MVQVTEKSTSKNALRPVEKFDRFEQRLNSPAWVYPLRKAGISRFAELGFPTQQQEDWRFTNVAPISRLPFRPVIEPRKVIPGREVLDTLPLARVPMHRLVFVDGHFSAELSQLGSLPEGVIVSSIAEALASGMPQLEKALARYADQEKQPFTALNTAFFQDGAFVMAPDGMRLEKPVELVFLSTGMEQGATTSPRILVVAGKNSEVTVVENYFGQAGNAYFTNAVTEIVADENARVEHCKLQDEASGAYHVSAVHVHASRTSNVVSHSISMGARIARYNIRTVLAGEGLECTLNGLFLTRGDQLHDHHMVVEHAEPHCASHEYFNGILDGRSKGVFHGRILVRPAAQKTDAKQTNKNLLLSDTATVDTKPQLEIYADDVKCTHGATIGQISDDSIFYLRSRGIDKDTAKRMLIHAFAGEIIERIRHAGLREELSQVVWQRLEDNPHVREQD